MAVILLPVDTLIEFTEEPISVKKFKYTVVVELKLSNLFILIVPIAVVVASVYILDVAFISVPEVALEVDRVKYNEITPLVALYIPPRASYP
jgi:hypothetical protein